MVLSAKKTERDPKRSNAQDRVKGRKARMTVKLDIHFPFAKVGRIIVKAIES